MQDRLEIRTNEDPVSHYVKITELIGPRKLDLPPEGGFYVRPASRCLILVRPKQKPLLVLREGMCLSSSKFRERHEFIVETRAELHSQKMKTVKIEIEKSRNKKTKPKMVDLDNYFISNIFKATIPCEEKKKERNTGVQVTISDDPYPIVTHLQALTREELPTAYLSNYLPKVWQDKNKLLTAGNRVLLKEGEAYSRAEISDVLLYIRLAGEHLAAVNNAKELHLKYCQAATFKDGRLT